MKVKRLTAIACLALGGATTLAPAAPDPGVQSLDAVAHAAERALRAQLDAGVTGVELEAVPLDPRLRLASCAAPLEAQAPLPRPGVSRALVRVSCASAAWTL